MTNESFDFLKLVGASLNPMGTGPTGSLNIELGLSPLVLFKLRKGAGECALRLSPDGIVVLVAYAIGCGVELPCVSACI